MSLTRGTDSASTSATVSVASGSGGTLGRSANAERRTLTIANISDSIIWVVEGTASQGGPGIGIPLNPGMGTSAAGETLMGDVYYAEVYKGQVWLFHARPSGTKDVFVSETSVGTG